MCSTEKSIPLLSIRTLQRLYSSQVPHTSQPQGVWAVTMATMEAIIVLVFSSALVVSGKVIHREGSGENKVNYDCEDCVRMDNGGLDPNNVPVRIDAGGLDPNVIVPDMRVPETCGSFAMSHLSADVQNLQRDLTMVLARWERMENTLDEVQENVADVQQSVVDQGGKINTLKVQFSEALSPTDISEEHQRHNGRKYLQDKVMSLQKDREEFVEVIAKQNTQIAHLVDTIHGLRQNVFRLRVKLKKMSEEEDEHKDGDMRELETNLTVMEENGNGYVNGVTPHPRK
ncbi:uncharacterized protein [Branchiostoma lanceolatum]|uniref:uncharacterized protein isoform X1 n=2 Tax=Branchiostoma lanceolatum TaxID=7740 RepID=UPI003453BD74